MRRFVLTAALLVGLASPAQAAKKPDLTVSKAAMAGTTVTWTVKSADAAAGKSTTGLVLSKDAKLDKTDVKLGSVATKAIKKGKTATGKRTVKTPGGLAAGRYRVLVCADSANKVKESKETNNCRAASSLTIDAPAAGSRPPAASGPVVTPPAFQPTPTAPAITATPTPEPFTTRLTEAPADVSPLQTARFAFTASEAADAFECRLDAAAFAPCASPHVITDILAGEHAFEVRARRGGTYAAVARKAWRIEFEAPAPGPTDAPAPAPEAKATIAKAGEITLVADTTEFLYTGADPIQKGVATGAIEATRAAVLRGKVLRRNGTPIEGVRVTVVDHAEYGRTATRTDGGFEIAVNGGSALTLEFEREGYVPSQRQLEVPTQEFERVDEIVMVPYEDRVTGVDLDAGGLQVAQGSTVTDGDGTRRATLLLEPGTEATATLPDGTEKPLGDRLNIRATEFTIGANGPAAMPGELPPTSAYTYAVEYSVDEADKARAVDVQFDKPIVTYVDNVVGFKAGTKVPMGYYDREQAQWVASKDGVVIKLVGKADGRALLDVDGDDAADTGAKLTAHGIDAAELAKLGELYAVGKSLWRAEITHFTPWDYNWPYGLPDGAGGPGQGGPENGDPPGDDPCGASGSIILCENQVLGEQSPIAGTPYALVYQSDRVPGRRTGDALEIPLTNATPPASMARVDLTIEVAGRTITKSYPRAPNLSETFVFDGKDAYGRPVQGRQRVDVTIDYVYPAVYRAPSTFGASFAALGGAVLSANRTRQEISVGQRWSGIVGGLNAPASALAGWSIDVHHTYDPIGRTLYLGDGTKRSADGQNFDVISTTATGMAAPEGMTTTEDGSVLVADSSAHVVRRIAPDGTTSVIAGTGSAGFGGDGGPATSAQLDHPGDVAVGPDGAIYIADESNHRIRRIVDGTITTFAGTGVGGYRGDGGPALGARLDEPSDVAADGAGSVYIVDRANHAIRRVGADGLITTLAGNGAPGFRGDGAVATGAQLRSPRDIAVRESDGSLFVADGGNHRVRRIDPDGTIETVAGDGSDAYRGDGGLATQAGLNTPTAVMPLRDGGLLVADAGNSTLRKVASQGTIDTVAGNGTPGWRGDGGPAAQARIDFPQAIALGADETIYLADSGNDRVRQLAPSLPGLTLGEFSIASEDGRSLYVFDRSGRHLRTRDTLTGATVLTFGYDGRGRLTSIEDGDANRTIINRDAAGQPTAIVAPFGQQTTLTVSGGGYLSSIANPAGDRILATYDAGGLLTALTDPRDGVHTFGYDALGRLTRDTAADGTSQVLTRTVSGNAVTVTRTSGAGRPTRYRVERTEDGGVKRTVTDGAGHATVSVVGNDGVTTVTQPDGTRVTEEVGPDPRFGMQSPVTTRMTMTTPGGLRTNLEGSRTVELTAGGALRSLSETSTVNDRTHTTRFDAATRRFTDASPTGRTLITEVDAQSRPIRLEVTGITPSVYTYDARGRLARTAQGTRFETYTYDLRGRVSAITDSLSRATAFTYDDADRPSSQTTPDGRTVLYRYDRNGNLTSVTPPGRPAYGFAYDQRNVMTTFTPPTVALGGPTTYTTDKDALITGVNRPDGGSIGFTYDDAQRLTELTQPRGTTRFSYSAATGRMTAAAAPGGERTEYAHDGPLPVRTTVAGAFGGEITRAFDNELRLTSETVAGTTAVTYAFDGDGMLTRAGGLTLNRRADDGLVGSLVAGGNTTTITRSSFGEPESSVAKQGSTTTYGESYTRDNTGRITAKTETRGTASTTWTYAFDAADRLATVTRSGEPPRTYAYDANGNRATARSGEPISYDDQDRITSVGGRTYTYNAAGDLTSDGRATYTYDALGALTRVQLPGGPVIDYTVDAAGRRVGVKKNGVVQRGFLYGSGLGPVAELNADGTVKSRFVYATKSNVPDLIVQGATTLRVITDQTGSPRAVVNVSTGAVVQQLDYDEFGTVTREVGGDVQPFRFGGGLGDPDTGLVRFGARDYDPETGRFTTQDPLRFGGGSTNLYGYALNDPVNLGDPTGQILDTLLDVGFIAYDLFDIGRSLMNGCGVSGAQFGALGADVAGALIPFATGGGMAVRAGAHASDAARGAGNVTEGIYETVTKEGLPYVGQSNNIDRRLAEHVRSGKISQEAADAAARTEVLGGKTAREIAEQRRINGLTGGVGASSPDIANKVNPIGPKRQHLLGP